MQRILKYRSTPFKIVQIKFFIVFLAEPNTFHASPAENPYLKVYWSHFQRFRLGLSHGSRRPWTVSLGVPPLHRRELTNSKLVGEAAEGSARLLSSEKHVQLSFLQWDSIYKYQMDVIQYWSFRDRLQLFPVRYVPENVQ